MALLSEHRVGRAEELGAFNQLLTGLDSGEGAAVALVGEPGIGKTRLLAELGARADALGHLVLSGSASELERDLPFSVFVDALDEYVESLEPGEIDRLSGETLGELATVLPSLSDHGLAQGAAVQQERFRSHRAVRELLDLLATPQPLVLLLDDLHWSDPGSIELLSALLRRPSSGAVLLAFALRPRQVPERLLSPRELAHRSGTLTRLELEALTRAEAGELLRAPEETWLTSLYEESGGNPFYLQQLARRGQQGVRAGGRDLARGGVDVPSAVAAALGEELALLSDAARRGLDAAAVAGDPFESELAAAAAEVTDVELLAMLDELLALDLTRPTDVPRRFRFRHPLVRRVVYESTPAGWRIGAHERCAQALAARGAPPAMRAHHVEWSARHGDLDAVATLREAGEAAQQRTPESAARWFGAALRLLPSTSSSDDRVELLLAQAGALAAAGRFAESHSALVDTMKILPSDATVMRARLTARCARLGHPLRRRVEARIRLERALAEVHDRDSPEAVSLMLALAVEGYYDMEPEALYTWAGRALDAKNLAPVGLRAEALALRANGAVLVGRGAEAVALLDEAEALVDGLEDHELESHLDALAHVGTAEFYFPRFAAAVEHVERALRIGRATGQADLFPSLYPVLATALGRLGRITEAIDVADTALEVARLLDNTHQVAWGLVNRSNIALVAGDLDFALSGSEEAMELAKKLDGALISVASAYARGRALFAAGDGAAAAELLERAAGGPSLPRQPVTSRIPSLQILARCYLSVGRTADAERAVRGAAELAEQIGLPLAVAYSDVASAYVALELGDYGGAVSLALGAVATFDSLDDVYSATTTRALAGRALAADGRRDDAARELARAAAIFESWGALRYRDEAERELRKLGRRRHRRTAPGEGDGLGSLTKRELEVATLVSHGKSNPEIAAELFLSHKTVESHIRNIFRKLDVSSRIHVALAVDRASLEEAEPIDG